jgi:hypothetical protein
VSFSSYRYAGHLFKMLASHWLGSRVIDPNSSMLAHWVGRAAYELRSVFDALINKPKCSNKLFRIRRVPLTPGRVRSACAPSHSELAGKTS